MGRVAILNGVFIANLSVKVNKNEKDEGTSLGHVGGRDGIAGESYRSNMCKGPEEETLTSVFEKQ